MDKLGPGSVRFWLQSNKKGPRGGKFLSVGVLNITSHMPHDVHLHQPHGSLKPLPLSESPKQV